MTNHINIDRRSNRSQGARLNNMNKNIGNQYQLKSITKSIHDRPRNHDGRSRGVCTCTRVHNALGIDSDV